MTVRYFWHKKSAKTNLGLKAKKQLKSLLATVPVFCSLPFFNTQRPNDFHDRRRYRKLGQGPNSGKFGDAFAPRYLAPATLNFRVLELAPDEQLSRGQRLRQRRVQARRQVAQTRPIAIVVFFERFCDKLSRRLRRFAQAGKNHTDERFFIGWRSFKVFFVNLEMITVSSQWDLMQSESNEFNDKILPELYPVFLEPNGTECSSGFLVPYSKWSFGKSQCWEPSSLGLAVSVLPLCVLWAYVLLL